MKKPDTGPEQLAANRRRFLQGVAAAGGAAAVGAAVPGALAGDGNDAVQNPAETAPSKGYRLTQHIVDYYKAARS